MMVEPPKVRLLEYSITEVARTSSPQLLEQLVYELAQESLLDGIRIYVPAGETTTRWQLDSEFQRPEERFATPKDFGKLFYGSRDRLLVFKVKRRDKLLDSFLKNYSLVADTLIANDEINRELLCFVLMLDSWFELEDSATVFMAGNDGDPIFLLRVPSAESPKP